MLISGILRRKANPDIYPHTTINDTIKTCAKACVLAPVLIQQIIVAHYVCELQFGVRYLLASLQYRASHWKIWIEQQRDKQSLYM